MFRRTVGDTDAGYLAAKYTTAPRKPGFGAGYSPISLFQILLCLSDSKTKRERALPLRGRSFRVRYAHPADGGTMPYKP